MTPSGISKGLSPRDALNAKYAFKSAFVSKYRTKITTLKEPVEEDHESDSASVKLEKKKARKEARKVARLAREKLKKEDPFSYYFGKLDPDIEEERKKVEKKMSRNSMMNLMQLEAEVTEQNAPPKNISGLPKKDGDTVSDPESIH